MLNPRCDLVCEFEDFFLSSSYCLDTDTSYHRGKSVNKGDDGTYYAELQEICPSLY